MAILPGQRIGKSLPYMILNCLGGLHLEKETFLLRIPIQPASICQTLRCYVRIQRGILLLTNCWYEVTFFLKSICPTSETLNRQQLQTGQPAKHHPRHPVQKRLSHLHKRPRHPRLLDWRGINIQTTCIQKPCLRPPRFPNALFIVHGHCAAS